MQPEVTTLANVIMTYENSHSIALISYGIENFG